MDEKKDEEAEEVEEEDERAEEEEEEEEEQEGEREEEGEQEQAEEREEETIEEEENKDEGEEKDTWRTETSATSMCAVMWTRWKLQNTATCPKNNPNRNSSKGLPARSGAPFLTIWETCTWKDSRTLESHDFHELLTSEDFLFPLVAFLHMWSTQFCNFPSSLAEHINFDGQSNSLKNPFFHWIPP